MLLCRVGAIRVESISINLRVVHWEGAARETHWRRLGNLHTKVCHLMMLDLVCWNYQLENRRTPHRMSFAYDVLTRKLDCEFFRCKFVLNELRDSARSWKEFAISFHRTKKGQAWGDHYNNSLWNEFLKANRTVLMLEGQDVSIFISEEKFKRRVVYFTIK